MFGISLLNNSLWQYQFMNHSQPQVCLWCIMKWAWQWLLIDPMAMLKCNRKQSNNNSDFLLNISYKKHPIITTIHTHIHTKSSLESPINLITACPLSVEEATWRELIHTWRICKHKKTPAFCEAAVLTTALLCRPLHFYIHSEMYASPLVTLGMTHSNSHLS